MIIGASTSNLYPDLTEDAMDMLLTLGFRELEVFVNTASETTPAFTRMLRQKADEAGARIRSLHPYMSGSEPYMLFSAYERRFWDTLTDYERFFESARILGADFVVMHGDKLEGVLPMEESIGRFEAVYDRGQAYGVHLVQENVFNFRSSNLDYIRKMRAQLGEKARFVLDIKQCRRSHIPVLDMLKAMGNQIVHVHISDQSEQAVCLVPGQGTNDYAALFDRLKALGFDGSCMLELYRTNFHTPQELVQGKQYLEKVLHSLDVE